MGRPKRQFTAEQIQQIEELALCNCQYQTIASVLDIPVNTLKRRFGRKVRTKHAEYKTNLIRAQYDKAVNSKDVQMLKWLGIQHLDQTDKQTIKTEAASPRLDESEKAVLSPLVRDFKLKLAERN